MAGRLETDVLDSEVIVPESGHLALEPVGGKASLAIVVVPVMATGTLVEPWATVPFTLLDPVPSRTWWSDRSPLRVSVCFESMVRLVPPLVSVPAADASVRTAAVVAG